MIAPLRPSSGLQPATRMVAGFRLPSFRPPCIHEAHFRHRGASVSGALLPSATVAAWHPGPAARSGGRRRFALAAPGFTHARGTRDDVSAIPSAASRCSPSLATLSVCLWWCLTESGRGYCRPTLLPYPSASTGLAASLAKPDHASFFIVTLSLP